jgi:hypothetical protein
MTQPSEFESDLTINPLVQYQQMLEDVLEIHRKERKTPSRLHLQTMQMIRTLNLWWLSIPQPMRSMCKSVPLGVTNPQLTARRPFQNSVLSLENTYIRDGPALPLPSQR